VRNNKFIKLVDSLNLTLQTFSRETEAFKPAPIAVVMLPEALAF